MVKKAVFVIGSVLAFSALSGITAFAQVTPASVAEPCSNSTGDNQTGDCQGDFPVPASPTVPLALILTCNTFDDFYNYTFTLGPGATPALTSLSYTLLTTGATFTGTKSTGTITFSTTTAASITPGLPLSYVRTKGLTETGPGTYTFKLETEFELVPATLTVTDSNGITGSTTVPIAGTGYCQF
jgi:hypothetical protein